MTDQTSTPPFPLPPGFPDRAAFEAEWCAELRSGKYEQGRNQLRNGNLRCCLGVACDVVIRHGVGEWKGNSFVSPYEEAKMRILPDVLRWHLGLDRNGAPVDGDCFQSLSRLNDNGVPFDVIADVIDGTIAYADAEREAGVRG